MRGRLIHFKEQKFTLFLIFSALVAQNGKTILQCFPQQRIYTNQVTSPLPHSFVTFTLTPLTSLVLTQTSLALQPRSVVLWSSPVSKYSLGRDALWSVLDHAEPLSCGSGLQWRDVGGGGGGHANSSGSLRPNSDLLRASSRPGLLSWSPFRFLAPPFPYTKKAPRAWLDVGTRRQRTQTSHGRSEEITAKAKAPCLGAVEPGDEGASPKRSHRFHSTHKLQPTNHGRPRLWAETAHLGSSQRPLSSISDARHRQWLEADGHAC